MKAYENMVEPTSGQATSGKSYNLQRLRSFPPEERLLKLGKSVSNVKVLKRR